MIESFTSDFAKQMGVPLSGLSVVDGNLVGCYDVFLLHIDSHEKRVSTLIYKAELEAAKEKLCSDRLELKIRSALERLSLMINDHN